MSACDAPEMLSPSSSDLSLNSVHGSTIQSFRCGNCASRYADVLPSNTPTSTPTICAMPKCSASKLASTTSWPLPGLNFLVCCGGVAVEVQPVDSDCITS